MKPGTRLLPLWLVVLPAVRLGDLQAQDARAKADSLAHLAEAAVSADTGASALGRAAALLTQAADWYGRAGAPEKQSEILSSVGRLYHRLRRLSLAVEFYGRAVAIDRALADSAALAIDLRNLGGVYRDLANADTAVGASFDGARRMLEESLETRLARRDSAGAARVLRDIGIVLHDWQLHDSSRAVLRRAAELSAASGETDAAAEARMIAARFGRDEGLYREALEDYDAAARLSTNTSRLATVQAEMGLAYTALGRFDNARVFATLAKRAANDDDLDQTDFLGLSTAFRAIGELEMVLGRPDSAILSFRKAWACAEAAGLLPTAKEFSPWRLDSALVEKALSCSQEVAFGVRPDPAAVADMFYSLLLSLGHWYLEMGRADSALQVYRRVFDLGHPDSEVLRGLGIAHLRLGHMAMAIEWLRKARRQPNREAGRAHVSAVLSDLAESYATQGQPRQALALLDTALAIAREINAPQAMVTALSGIARIYHRIPSVRRLDVAVSYYDSAATITHLLAGYTGDALTRMTFMERRTSLHEEWVLAWVAHGRAVASRRSALAALAAADEGRAEGLKRLLGGAPARGSKLIGEAWERGRWLDSITTENGASLVYYLVTSDTLVTWFHGPRGGLTVSWLTVPRDSLRELVARVRGVMGPVDDWSSCSHTGSMEPDPREPLRRLAQILLPPIVLQALRGSREVVISPHGFLAGVPFAALEVDSSGMPFGVRHALRYAPSLEVLHQLVSGPGLRSGDSGQALVVADPEMPTLHDVCSLLTFRPSRLNVMGAWSGRLATRLGARFLTDTAATEIAVRSLLRRASILHFGTHAHAYTREDQALESWIALGPSRGRDASGSERGDGMLKVREIAEDLSFAAELVVLGACQTGLGDSKRAEGVVGLPWAFLSRGARSVLASLWVVDEAATVRLLDAFYRHWLDDADRPNKAESLRRAQEDLWQSAPPGAWASFQLIGGN